MPSYDSLPFPLSFSSLSIYPVLFFRPSSVHPSIILPPPLFFFFLFASFRILTPHSIGGLLFSREGVGLGSVIAMIAECSSGGGGAAALDVGPEGEGVADGACVISPSPSFPIIWLVRRSTGFLSPDVELRVRCNVMQRPFATAIHVHTLVVLLPLTVSYDGGGGLGHPTPTQADLPCSLAFVSPPPPCHFVTPLTCGSFWWIPEAEMASRPSVSRLPRRERRKMIRFGYACPCTLSQKLPPLLSLSISFFGKHKFLFCT
jgi:hypothetical protein